MIWSADGYPGWSADGYPGWSADGYIPDVNGGTNARHRRRYLVEMFGQTIEAHTEEEAQAMLLRAKTLAAQSAEKGIASRSPAIRLPGQVPTPMTPFTPRSRQNAPLRLKIKTVLFRQ